MLKIIILLIKIPLVAIFLILGFALTMVAQIYFHLIFKPLLWINRKAIEIIPLHISIFIMMVVKAPFDLTMNLSDRSYGLVNSMILRTK